LNFKDVKNNGVNHFVAPEHCVIACCMAWQWDLFTREKEL
jgi:hypothetical protein